MPITTRTFVTTDQVLSFVRVYQGGIDAVQPVAMSASIRNGTDRVVFTRADSIAAAQFDAARGSDHRLVLPLGMLTAGDYVLTLEAAVGKVSARRDVRFAIR